MGRMKLVALLLAAVVGLSACGGSSGGSGRPGTSTTSTTKQVRFAKTKFLLHAGLAFGAFHRYIYKPFRAGVLNDPLHHKVALVRAGAAGLFVVHEAKLAAADAQGSATLRKLAAPVTALAATVTAFAARAKSGQLDRSALDSANGAIDSIKSKASSAGAPITERAPPANP